MSRIKIEDLPVLEELESKEARGIFGGAIYAKYDDVGGDVGSTRDYGLRDDESTLKGRDDLTGKQDLEGLHADIAALDSCWV